MPGRTSTRASTATRSTRTTRGTKATSKTQKPATPEAEEETTAIADSAEDGQTTGEDQDSSLRRTICQLFYDAQKTLAGHRKLVVSLRKVQETCCYEPVSASATGGHGKQKDEDFEETDFNAEFTRCILRVLPVRKSEGAADRVIRFMTSFLRFATEKDAELVPETDGDEEMVVETPTTRLTNEILSIVVPLLLAKDKFVRYRATQIIRHVVSSLESIDDEIYQVLRTGLLKRIRDKEAMIRVQAVMGLTHLLGNDEGGANDDEDDEEDQGLLDKLIDVLQNDSSADVRKTLLLNLPLTPVTLPFLLERARDVDPGTRRALYSKLLPSLGDFRHLSLSMREKLLRWGLRDRDDTVHNATARLFRERWIEDIAGAEIPEEQQKPGQPAPASIDALLELMERIDIVNSAMQDGIALQAFKEFWEGRPDYVEAISFEDPFWDNLTAESIFMARSFNDFCRQDNSRWGDMLEEKMPEVTKLGFMLQRYYSQLTTLLRQPEHTDEEAVEPEFIVEQLLHIAETLDYADEIGRRKMYSLLREMVATPELPDEITKLAEGVLRNVCGSDSHGERDFCGVVLEAIAEVHDTIADPEDLMPDDPDDSFHSAKSQVTDDTVTSRSVMKPMIRNTDGAEDQEKVIKEIMINMKCLHIAQCMLENVGEGLQANVHLVTMLNNLVVPAVRSHEAPIRERGLQCLGLCCLLDKQLAEENLTLFLHCFSKGHPTLQVHALETLCDILSVYPSLVAPVSPATPMPGATHASTEDSTESPNLKPLTKAFSKAIRVSSADAGVLSTAVICLSKLYLTNVLTDDALLQQLILTFFDPASAENHAARQALSYFLPAFAHSRRENMEVVGRVAADVVRGLVAMHDEYEDEDDGLASARGGAGIVGINTAVSMLADWTDARRLVQPEDDRAKAGPFSLLDDASAAEKKKPDGDVHLDVAADALERATARGAEKEYRKALLSLVAKLTIVPESDPARLEEVKLLVDDTVDGKIATETASKNALVKMQLALYKALSAAAAAPTDKGKTVETAETTTTTTTTTSTAQDDAEMPDESTVVPSPPPTVIKKRRGRPKKSSIAPSVVKSIENEIEDDDDGTSTIKGDDDDAGTLDESLVMEDGEEALAGEDGDQSMQED